MLAGVLFAVAEDDQNFTALVDGGQFFGDAEVDGVVECGAEFTLFFRADLGKVHVALVEAANAVHDGGCGRSGIADEAEVIAEAEREGLIAGLEDLLEEGFDILLMLFDELLLASACVDNETDAERKLGIVGKEPDLLRYAIFDHGKVVLR